MTRLRPIAVLLGGLLVGLLLAALDHLLPPAQVTSGPLRSLVVGIDWTAPPLAGLLTSAAVLYALRHKKLLDAERAASQVLSERLLGIERRQAIWVVAASVAHDLKNPLHNLQLLLEEMESDPQRTAELLPRVRANATRATERLAELQRAGQSHEGDSEPVQVSRVLDELRARLLPAATAQRTTLHTECPKGLSVNADALALRSAIEHVAANSLEALHRQGGGGRLQLQARAAGDRLEVDVLDDGPGIPSPLRERLFTPFVSGGGDGTGLGLAIARALARASGGDLTLQTAEPGATRFSFTFPSRPLS